MRAFLEPEINKEASTYIEENYEEIKRQVLKFGVHPDKASDLVNDVYISIVMSENEGEGYDFNKSSRGDGITVAQFVYGRLKGYSKNIRYRGDIIDGRNNKDKRVVVVASSCTDTSELERLSSFQKAYALAESEGDVDSIGDILAENSILEELDYCIRCEDRIGFSIVTLLRNIEDIMSSQINKSVFNALRDAVLKDEELAEAFRSVLEFSAKNRDKFNGLLDRIEYRPI